MANKQSDYARRLKKIISAACHEHRVRTINWCADAAVLAANEVFQRKGKILNDFLEKYFEYSQEIARMTIEDAKGDKSLEYTKTKVDERLKEILGENFLPWEERHAR